MPTERARMLAGEPYDPMDPELVAARARARDLCWDLNATRERDAGISASNSCRNFVRPDTTGVAHESLSTQMVLPLMLSEICSSVSRSSGVPPPFSMRRRILAAQVVPSRQGVHCPQLSCL